MVHMRGNIYYRTGDYERARQAFLDSKAVDEAYMKAQKISTYDDWNYSHNLSYLIAAQAEAGRYRQAMKTAGGLPKIPPNSFRAKGSANHVLTMGRSLERLYRRYGNGQETAKERDYNGPPRYSRPELESLGGVYLRAHDWEHAREAFEQALKQRPKSGFALYGIAQAYAGAGNTAAAERAYADFGGAWAHA